MPGSELRGKLIQTASIAAYRGGQPYMAHYAATKAGVVSVTRTAAQVLAAVQDHVELHLSGRGRHADVERASTPIGPRSRAGRSARRGSVASPTFRSAAPKRPSDVAGVVSFLASRDSDYMTGQAIHVDGGLVMGN